MSLLFDIKSPKVLMPNAIDRISNDVICLSPRFWKNSITHAGGSMSQ
jgi:hypothetical protein